jgi:cation transporter-like permease
MWYRIVGVLAVSGFAAAMVLRGEVSNNIVLAALVAALAFSLGGVALSWGVSRAARTRERRRP